jgi:hypothetical protein
LAGDASILLRYWARDHNKDWLRCGLKWVANVQGDCKLGLEGIVSKRLDAPYKSGPSKIWLKIKNPKVPAATRAVNGTF